MSTVEVGRAGERLVAADLESKGWRLVARNLRFAFAEVDLVAEDGGSLVFVEVKSWRRVNDELLAKAMGSRKRRRLVRAARKFVDSAPEYRGWPLRIDLVVVDGGSGTIHHYEDVVLGEG